jgi:hypothetical protein
VEATAWNLDQQGSFARVQVPENRSGAFELNLDPGRYLFVLRGFLGGEPRDVVQRTAMADVALDRPRVDLACSTNALELRAEETCRHGTAPEATLVSIVGKPCGHGIALIGIPTNWGWSFASVPSGALVRLRGSSSSGLVVDRDVSTGTAGGAIEWE